eukprot:Selendium_serpulae@DN2112_c0_g2_i1.p2
MLSLSRRLTHAAPRSALFLANAHSSSSAVLLANAHSSSSAFAPLAWPCRAQRSMHLKAVHSGDGPPALGPYSAAIRAGDSVFFSGQLGIDKEGQLVDVRCPVKQTQQCLTNLKNLVESSGLRMSDIVKTTVLLTDMAHFAKVNEVYASFFPPDGATPPPARICFAVKALPKDAAVEIDAIAVGKATG